MPWKDVQKFETRCAGTCFSPRPQVLRRLGRRTPLRVWRVTQRLRALACSCRKFKFGSQHQHQALTTACNPSSRGSHASSGLQGHLLYPEVHIIATYRYYISTHNFKNRFFLMSLRWALACVTQGSFELKKVKRPPLQKGVMSKGVEELKPFCVKQRKK